MLSYETLSEKTAARIRRDRAEGRTPALAAREEDARRRRDEVRDRGSLWRGPYLRDIDKILHCPFYNRYTDKTQVFAFYRNNDLTRRGLHVQLVSRIARTIGSALGLNLDLIEAIALGHDIGHTPFGHAGERYLDALLAAHTGRHFSHNVHSVRVLDRIFPYNITLETLSGIAGHDGESEQNEYRPHPLADFSEFDALVESAYLDRGEVKHLHPSTLEGCCVRIADIIAYLGKDRQDAARAGLVAEEDFTPTAIGHRNAEIINNMIVNIIECSYGEAAIRMDDRHFAAIAAAKQENYERIYLAPAVRRQFDETVAPMMERLYHRLFDDLTVGREESPIFSHHIAYVTAAHYERSTPYAETEPNQLVVDYIASMTDGYFVELYRHLFGETPEGSAYRGYFE